MPSHPPDTKTVRGTPRRAHPAQTQPPADSPTLASCQVFAYLPPHSLSAIVSNQFRKQLLEQLENITRKNYIIIVRLDLRHFKKKKAELSPNRDPSEEKDGVPGEQGGCQGGLGPWGWGAGVSICWPSQALTALQAEASEAESGRPRAFLMYFGPSCRTGRPESRARLGGRWGPRDRVAQA